MNRRHGQCQTGYICIEPIPGGAAAFLSAKLGGYKKDDGRNGRTTAQRKEGEGMLGTKRRGSADEAVNRLHRELTQKKEEPRGFFR